MANVKVHDMPPEDSSKKPTEEERQQFADWIGKLKYLAPRDPGPFVIRRLTKTEYANTLRDLYGVDPAITQSLPEEVVGKGFLNSISSLQSELFLDIANKVVNQVVAPEGKSPTTTQKQVFGEASAKGTDLREVARSLASSASHQQPHSSHNVDTDHYSTRLARYNHMLFPHGHKPPVTVIVT